MDSLSHPAVWKETGLVFGYSSSRDALDFFNIQTGVLDRSATLRPRGENSRYHDGAGPVMGAYINPRGDRFFALGYQPVLYSASIADIYAGKAL